MSDEYFTEFLEDEGFAPALACTPVDQETLTRYEGILPDRLLGYWKEFGFCGYGEGRFWLVGKRGRKKGTEPLSRGFRLKTVFFFMVMGGG